MPTLNNWSVTTCGNSVYDAPETYTQRLHGFVFGHKMFHNGERITTSSIVRVVDGNIVTASGTVYELGDVDPEYEALYPNAKERLISSVGGQK